MTASQRSLAHMPVTVFASVMGVGALSLAWKRAAHLWELPTWPSLLILAIAAGLYVLVVCAYLAKWALHPKAARAELSHKMRMPFVPTITIATLVLATAGADVAPGLASIMWWVGALGHLLATALVLTAWSMRPDITSTDITPAWLIPIVGNVITPLAAPQIGNIDLAWFSFGVGMVFWGVFLTLIIERLLMHDKGIPAKLMPTYAIMVAPPAVALVAWSRLGHESDDPLSRILLSISWMFALLIGFQAKKLLEIPFALPYLAYTFPVAALAVASLVSAEALPGALYQWLALIALAVASIAIPIILVGVLVLTFKGRIFEAE